MQPASFPHPVQKIERVETALSWVVLTGSYAYKIKKPVHHRFVDASTLAQRHQLCLEELRLNRRFGPDIYLDVLPIVERDARLLVGAPGEALEYCVRMRQFDRRHDLEHELRTGRIQRGDLVELGQHLAAWHARAEVDTARFGSPERVGTQIMDIFPELRGAVPPATAARLERLETLTRRRLDALRELLQLRRVQGRVRECHGDLHAGNIVRWKRRLQPFDCLEFDPALRWIDVASDVAFLYMDLIARRHAALAFDFVSAYVEQGGDYQALRLLNLFGLYRALVRARVDTIALAGSAGESDRRLRGRRYRRLGTAVHLAREHRPALLLMHGVTGSGKSWVSERLIGALCAVRVRSDLERRRLFGPGAYAPRHSAATYQRLLECATDALTAGLPVIVDAAFLDASSRLPFQELATDQGCPLAIIDCRAPKPTLLERLARRQASAHDPSEGTAAVLQMQLGELQPLGATETGLQVPIDTTVPEALLQAVRELRVRLHTGYPRNA